MNLFNREVPWGNRESIYAYIVRHINDYGKLTTEDLPDDEVKYQGTEVRWAAGAMDGVFGHHGACSEEDVELARLSERIAGSGKEKDKIEFYNFVKNDNCISSIDNVIDEIVKLQVKVTKNLLDWIEFLAFESPDRGAVKVGIALLGATGTVQVKEQIKMLGRHEEFTLYAAVALISLSDNPEAELWELAKKVHGWGRIHLVERLSETEDSEIKSWILTEGYKNSIMYEYLAYIAADTGGLKNALSDVYVEDDILLAASDVLQALIAEGPVAGISIYQDAAESITLYIKHTYGRRNNLSYLLAYDSIYSYIADTHIDWDGLHANGWDEDKRAEIAKLLKSEFDNEEWKQHVIKMASTDEDLGFWEVNRAAKILEINFFNVHWKRLQKDQLDQTRWFNIMESVTAENIDDVLEYAVKVLPLEKVATGADSVLGLSKDYNLYNTIGFIVQSLDKYEGKGEDILLAALKSPVTGNRNMAIKVLTSWSTEHINQNLKNAIEEAEKNEPEDEVKERLVQLLTRF